MDQLTKTVKRQIVGFMVISVVSVIAVATNYVGLPNMLFGIGHYNVSLQLPESGSLYPTGNVSYRGPKSDASRVSRSRRTVLQQR